MSASPILDLAPRRSQHLVVPPRAKTLLLAKADGTDGRFHGMDLLRGFCVLFMVETHVVNAVLAAQYKTTAWFGYLNYLNGLVAPTFFFLAGLAVAMREVRPPNLRSRSAPAWWHRFRQPLTLLAYGYLLHLPWGRLVSQPLSLSVHATATQIDVLQCLAATIALGCATGFCPRPVRLALRVVLFLGVLALTPFVPEWNPDPAWVAAWLTPITGSWFPLFPWVGFGLIGMLIAPAVKKPVWIWPSMAALSAACSQAVPPIGQAGFGIPFFFERLAWVLLSLGVCSALLSVPGFRNRKPMLIGGVMQIGRASLGYYIGHLVLGGFTMQLLVERLSPAALQATPAGCGIAVLLLTAATAIIVHAMHRITERNRPRKQAECTRVLSAHTENEVRSAIKVNAR